jgi:hypothetical protein
MDKRYWGCVAAASLPDDPEKKGKIIREFVIELMKCIPVQNGKTDWNTLKVYVKEPLNNIKSPFDNVFEDKTGFTIIGYTIEEKEDEHQAGNGADHPEGQ